MDLEKMWEQRHFDHLMGMYYSGKLHVDEKRLIEDVTYREVIKLYIKRFRGYFIAKERGSIE